MRRLFLLPIYLVLIIITLYSPAAKCQTPTYTCTITNDTLKSSNVYEFDIYLQKTGNIPMQLAGMQMGFTYNNAVKNGGSITASWVTGSADPGLITSGQGYGNLNTSTAGLIKIAAKLATKGPGTGTSVSESAPGIRIGRLRLTNSVPFISQNLNLKWNFSLPNYPTKLSAYVPPDTAGINTDITDEAEFVNNLANPTLPVELTSFVSNVTGREILLSWETKTELNTKEFEITRTKLNTDGSLTAWYVAGVLKAAGTSVSPNKYSYTEKDLQVGKYRYKLKVVDNDGSYKYSNIIETEIALPKEFSINQNYPNPFNPTTKIEYQLPADAQVILEVFNITGQKVADLVNQEEKAGYYSVNFGSISNKLASGVYIYRFTASGKAGSNFSSMKKMMLLK